MNYEENNYSQNIPEVFVNREHKDRLFKIIFQEKADLLCLYNAINGTTYDNPEDLHIITMEDIIYISMKNDLSFILDDQIALFEHQSTVNPNLPMCGLLYLGRQYEQYIHEHHVNLFSSTLQKLPFPQFYVFYNGTSTMPDRVELKLSDAFILNEHTQNLSPALECTAVLLNINDGCNQELMNNCKVLGEYAQFMSILREYLKKLPDKTQAIMETINYCIEHDILRRILIREKGRVIDVLLTECDWDYVKKLYEYDMEQLQADNVQLHSAIEQLHSDNVQLHSYSEQLQSDKEQLQSDKEQLQFDKEQFRSYTEQLLHIQLQNCKQMGSSKSDAITLIQKQIPSLSDQLIMEVADVVFDS